MRKRILTRDEREELLRVTRSIKAYFTKEKKQYLLFLTMPIIEYVMGIIYDSNGDKLYRRLFMRIVTQVTRYDPMTYMEAVEYWENIIKKMPREELFNESILLMERVLDSFIVHHPPMVWFRKHPPEDYLIGGLLYRIRNYFRDMETRKKAWYPMDIIREEPSYEPGTIDDDYGWGWVLYCAHNLNIDCRRLTFVERRVIQMIIEGYGRLEIRRSLNLSIHDYKYIINKIKEAYYESIN